MNAKQVTRILTEAIPFQEEWSPGDRYGPYHVKPNQEVRRILYCVTATPEVTAYAIEHRYDLLVSHHPYLATKPIPQLVFHTSLDCCTGGLNDQWREMLGVKDAEHFDRNLGWSGKIDPISFDDLVKKCEAFVGHPVTGQLYSELKTISSVVICTGLGGLVTEQALATDADCYILGELICPAEETGFRSVLEVGHTLSEQMGVNLIRKLLPDIQVDLAPLELDYFGAERSRKPAASKPSLPMENEDL